MRKKMINLSASLLGIVAVTATLFSCSNQQQESPLKAKVEEYARVELKSDLVNNLNDKEKELVRIFFQVGEITDNLYNPQIQISAESGTKRSNFRQKDKTKRSKKGCTQHL